MGPVQQQVRIACQWLGLQPPFTSTDFQQALARKLDSRIEMLPHELRGSGLFGSCSSEGDILFVFYHSDARFILQECIKYHELGHIYFGHVRAGTDAAYQRGGVASTAQDYEVEAFARAMTVYALGFTQDPCAPGESPSVEPSSRLEQYLNDLGP